MACITLKKKKKIHVHKIEKKTTYTSMYFTYAANKKMIKKYKNNKINPLKKKKKLSSLFIC